MSFIFSDTMSKKTRREPDNASQSVLGITLERFRRNLPGVISFWFIVAVGLVALLAYLLAPDNTTNANTMHLALSNKTPGDRKSVV